MANNDQLMIRMIRGDVHEQEAGVTGMTAARQSGRVLVVDDEEAVADLYAARLESEHDVITAYDGERALEVVDDNIDVVFLDRQMPGCPGDEVLDVVDERDLDCRVVMVTAVDPGFDILEMYENRDGGFHRVDDAGIDGDRWSLAASFTDLTGDGHPDVHVANDYNSDVLYINQGDGTFEQRFQGGATARNGMASEIADVTDDGRPDVFVSNIYLPASRETMGDERYERVEHFLSFVINSNRTKGNTLMVNQGDGEFQDQADELGVRHGGWGWAASFADFNNDGRRDLIHATQNVVAIGKEDPHYTYPMLWTNNGSGFISLDASERGLEEHDGRGLVTLELRPRRRPGPRHGQLRRILHALREHGQRHQQHSVPRRR